MAVRSRSSNGGEYILNSDLSWEVDGKQVTAKRGETRSDIPETSLGWLIEQGLIVPVSEAAGSITQASASSGENKES